MVEAEADRFLEEQWSHRDSVGSLACAGHLRGLQLSRATVARRADDGVVLRFAGSRYRPHA